MSLRNRSPKKIFPPLRAAAPNLLKFLGWLDLVGGGFLFIVAVPTFFFMLFSVLFGSTSKDHVGNLGITAVISGTSIIVLWAGCGMAFKGVHVSSERVRTSTGLWFKQINREDIASIDIERSVFRSLHRGVVVASLRDGQFVEFAPLSTNSEDVNNKLFSTQIQVVHTLRECLNVEGNDDAPPRPMNSMSQPRPIRLLPQERVFLHLIKNRYVRDGISAATDFEASHGRRGRILLDLVRANCVFGALIFLSLYGAVITRGGNLWLGYVIAMFFVVTGGIRLIQANRSRPNEGLASSEEISPHT